MPVKHLPAVQRYRCIVADLENGVANLKEFVNSLPLPDEQGHLLSVDDDFIYRIQDMHQLLAQVLEHADKAKG